MTAQLGPRRMGPYESFDAWCQGCVGPRQLHGIWVPVLSFPWRAIATDALARDIHSVDDAKLCSHVCQALPDHRAGTPQCLHAWSLVKPSLVGVGQYLVRQTGTPVTKRDKREAPLDRLWAA